jgi:hypothetical protein
MDCNTALRLGSRSSNSGGSSGGGSSGSKQQRQQKHAPRYIQRYLLPLLLAAGKIGDEIRFESTQYSTGFAPILEGKERGG